MGNPHYGGFLFMIHIQEDKHMKETVLNLQKYGINAVTNMLLIAKYISYGGPIIIKETTHEKPSVTFFDHNGDGCYWIFGDKFIDVDTALIKLFSLIEKDDIESFTFFVEDLYCMFHSSVINKRAYIKETYEDSELNMLRHHVTLTREQFINTIVNTENKTIGDIDELVKLFDIDKIALMESEDEVHRLLSKIC